MQTRDRFALSLDFHPRSWFPILALVLMPLLLPHEPAQARSLREGDESLVRQLPEKYRARVLQNLQVAGGNRPQLVKALTLVEPSHREALAFLLAYAPARDLQELSAEFLLENIQLSYEARKKTPWGPSIPEDIFLNNVLPYAHVTEKRENWRRDFYQRFLGMAVSEGSIAKAVKKLNHDVFTTFNVHYNATLRKKPDQSPSESMAIGWSSCTGLSILVADALRAVGIPARLAGIPLWPTGGNHTWVEVWDQGWHYIEADSVGEYDQTWFTGAVSNIPPLHPNPMTRIYAVSFEWTETHFPLVWDPSAEYVRAEDVTARYSRVPASHHP